MRLVAIKKWIKSHSAAEIGLANKARARLNRLYPTGKGSRAKYPAIPDERLPKRPLSAWTIYYGEHAASRSSGSVKERINTVLSDFKQLTSAERSVSLVFPRHGPVNFEAV
ncbi:uncharacterized protein K489DRAFT_382094 [Dissoconium aciculare CBS 342.82]|uniref:Uncharacterized protein n=1 Tax=Dissoconium aciculare CBS 342.82 TaxID=1314786 RepID=A0A6J3LZH7_9PEZI|nr:uncharacterized protein K489DRAFT_382094 [Dissoconium aciculare CBS 342.82]KAF1821058.1 hypothetical protein K489DRAFT_382094 [Dissoconium aciculare CBS 342.82]